MKKVIFVCLLSLSVCLSQPTNSDKEAAAVQSVPTAKTSDVTPPAAEHEQTQTLTAQTTTLAPAANATHTEKAQTPTTKTPQEATANEASSKGNETKPADKDNKTDTKTEKDVPKPADEKKVEPSKDKNETKPAVPADNKASNSTSVDGKDSKKNDTTTPKSEVVSPTSAPVEAKPRAFDGPSFIGGIILTLGLLAIGFMGFKYYKNQTERNYHTL